MAKKFKLISWNVNGIRAMYGKGLIDFIRKENADIYALQEIKANKEDLPKDLLNIKGYHAYWKSAKKKGYSGVALYCKKEPIDVIYGIGDNQFDDEGRTIVAEYDDYYFVNCYFPNSQPELKRIDYKLDFSNAILKCLNRWRKKKSIILCGDYNIAHKAIDLKNPKSNEKNPGYSIQERKWMDKFVNAGFIDTFRMFTKEGGHYTWWSYRFNARKNNAGWRIDYFCVDEESQKRVKAASILSDVMGSDHCPVTLEYC